MTFSDRITAIRGDGEAAGGLVRAWADGTGRLVGLVLAPEVMRWTATELAQEIVAAAGLARDAAGHQLTAAAEDVRDGRLAPDPVGGYAAEMADANDQFERRMDELATLAHDVLRRSRV